MLSGASEYLRANIAEGVTTIKESLEKAKENIIFTPTDADMHRAYAIIIGACNTFSI